MGKRRNTAKTGDHGIYKSRGRLQQDASYVVESNNDDMFDDVDRFHSEREKDVLKLGPSNDDDVDEHDEPEEAVMDLGVHVGSSDESSEESSDDEDERPVEEDAPSSSDDDDESEQKAMEQVRDWGKRKASYYHGDTADLEIGQDEEDAYLEEEAAKEVQAARYEEMSEDDFVLSDNDVDDSKSDDADVERVSVVPDVKKLSSKQKRKLLEKRHPELLPLVSHFSGVVQDLLEKTSVTSHALFEGEEGATEVVGATKLGLQYLLTKQMLQSSTALNLAVYLLLKSDPTYQDSDPSLIQSHPVLARLQTCNTLLEKLEDGVENNSEGLRSQLENLTKAVELMASEEIPRGDEDAVEAPEQVQDEDHSQEKRVEANDVEERVVPEMTDTTDTDTRQQTLNEARFGLRSSEINKGIEGRASRLTGASASLSDFGEGSPDDPDLAGSRQLASTLNSISQRLASRDARVMRHTEDIDELEADHGEVGQGIDLMEAEAGMGSGQEGAFEPPDEGKSEYTAGSERDEFYGLVERKAKAQKAAKKMIYQVAPKYPRMETEIDGERAIGRTILKNRGLVAHKPKLNRNPRVKKREQYRKALIRRKGTVRDIRRDEGHKYGGEETGIKSGLSRSRKLN